MPPSDVETLLDLMREVNAKIDKIAVDNAVLQAQRIADREACISRVDQVEKRLTNHAARIDANATIITDLRLSRAQLVGAVLAIAALASALGGTAGALAQALAGAVGGP